MMDLYLKALAMALTAAILALMLEKQGKEFSLLLLLLVCASLGILALEFLRPVLDFLEQLESLIPVEQGLLSLLLKIAGISVVGELAVRLCADSGSAAGGKALRFLTNILILWLCLPMLESLLDLIHEMLEALR